MTKIIIVNESTCQSIITDSYTFLCLFASLLFNHHCLGDSTVIKILISVLFFVVVLGKTSRKIKKMTPQEALEYLTKTTKSRPRRKYNEKP